MAGLSEGLIYIESSVGFENRVLQILLRSFAGRETHIDLAFLKSNQLPGSGAGTGPDLRFPSSSLLFK